MCPCVGKCPSRDDKLSDTLADSPFHRNETDQSCFLVVSKGVLDRSFLKLIGDTTVTAIYTLVFLTLGKIIRDWLVVPAPEVLLYEELPDPDDILDLIYGIYIVRAARYVGHLRDEIRLFETLVKVIRSSVITRCQKAPQRHHSPVKDPMIWIGCATTAPL